MNKKRVLKKLVKKVDSFDFSNFTELDFYKKTRELKARIMDGETVDDILPEAFALVRQASLKTIGLKHFDVQMLGGYILNKGAIAEMSTGAGKTLTATLPLYLNCLNGRGSHLVTVNDYLAKRDCEWMMPVYELLGVSCGYIIHDTPNEERKEIYKKDIVYVTNQELGFDYLRDNMAKRLENRVQRGYFNYAIIDEADSILIDEARTPLIISGQGKESSDVYRNCDLFIKSLSNKDYEKDLETDIYALSASGVKKAEKVFSIKNYSDAENILLRHHIEQALKANLEMIKDKHYVVKDNEIILIDEHTGRLAPGRRYNDGLHQAIEAKENVEIKNESITLATITYQNFFKMYKKFSGMTGTAMTEKKEFKEIYNLKVINIPDKNPSIRIDRKDLIYMSEKSKIDAIVKDVKEQYAKQRPVLIGTLDIKKSEELAERLRKENIPFNLLNAKQDEQENEIVSRAGQKGMVTISTNMAGRGTDIRLGEGVKELGGLKIIASERAVDRRIDNQLIGRAGRQGDPGESQFYLSLDDELIRYATASMKERLTTLDRNDPNPIDTGILSKLIYSCQKKIENRHFETRKNTTKYDKIINSQMHNIYTQRNFVLNQDCTDLLRNMVEPVFNTEYPKFKNTLLGFEHVFHIKANSVEDAIEKGKARIDEYIASLEDPKHLSEVILYVVDAYWVRYLEEMEDLRQNIRGLSFRNEDPVYSFNRKATELYEEMNYNIKKDIVRNILIAF